MQSPISGWFGHAASFAFDSGYRPLEGVGRFAARTPSVRSLSAPDAALSAFDGVAMSDVAAKARALGDPVVACTAALGLESISAADGRKRGDHVSVRHADGHPVTQTLIARGIIPDFRALGTGPNSCNRRALHKFIAMSYHSPRPRLAGLRLRTKSLEYSSPRRLIAILELFQNRLDPKFRMVLS